jgi:hypothetical protein
MNSKCDDLRAIPGVAEHLKTCPWCSSTPEPGSVYWWAQLFNGDGKVPLDRELHDLLTCGDPLKGMWSDPPPDDARREKLGLVHISQYHAMRTAERGLQATLTGMLASAEYQQSRKNRSRKKRHQKDLDAPPGPR